MKKLVSQLAAVLLYTVPAGALVTASHPETVDAPLAAAFDPVVTTGTLASGIIDARAGLMLDRRSARMSELHIASDDIVRTRFVDQAGGTAASADISGIHVVAASGGVALLAAAVGHRLSRRRRYGRPAGSVALDPQFEATAFMPAPTPAKPAMFDLPGAPPAGADVLRHFHPDAPPVPRSPVERSRPDYIRIDDAVEVWTPSKVDAARDAAAPDASRRRSDAKGSDYRFHRLNADGSLKTAERKTFRTDVDAHRFAERLGNGDAVEVWLDTRRVATIPANFLG